jgi:glycosyltransferase involved in cell wall biosynthesis
MRIGIDARCLEWNRGGVARYLVNMLKLWPQMAKAHTFVLYFQCSIPGDSFLKSPLYESKVLQAPAVFKRRRILTEQFFMAPQLSRDGVDLFFATWYSAPLLTRIKTVVAAWDISYSTHPHHYPLAQRISLGYFSRKSCTRAAGVVTCSDFDASQISRFYRIPESRILTVRLCADDRFTPLSSPARAHDVRKKYGIPGRYILSLGAIYNRRNVHTIIKGFTRIMAEFPDISLVVVGKNRTNPQIDIEGMMQPLVRGQRGTYIQWFDDEDLVDLYRAAMYYVCTSTVDGESIMLKEAMMAGTPVITSPLLTGSVGGVCYVIDDPTSETQTAEAFRQALRNPERRPDLISRGLEWNKQFSWARAARDTLDFLESR